MSTRWQRGIVPIGRTAAVLLAGSLLLAAGTEARAAGLLIADGGLGGVLEIDEHTVRVTINNGIAVTEVTQVFRQYRESAGRSLVPVSGPEGRVRRQFQHVDRR